MDVAAAGGCSRPFGCLDRESGNLAGVFSITARAQAHYAGLRRWMKGSMVHGDGKIGGLPRESRSRARFT
ncbi:hypothetical protein V2G26_020376 [Clonostachys chloroleuca]